MESHRCDSDRSSSSNNSSRKALRLAQQTLDIPSNYNGSNNNSNSNLLLFDSPGKSSAPLVPSASSGWPHSQSGVGMAPERTMSRRSSVVSTTSSFFERSFFASTPESRITELSKKTTLAYATLMLNLYNDITIDLKSISENNRRIVVQSVSSKGKVKQCADDLGRANADLDDALENVREIKTITSFATVKELLAHAIRTMDGIYGKRNKIA